jgi:hypothetical protein
VVLLVLVGYIFENCRAGSPTTVVQTAQKPPSRLFDNARRPRSTRIKQGALQSQMRTQQRSGIPALAVGHERRTVESEYLAVAAEGFTLFRLRFPSECLPFQTPADGIESLPIRAVRCSAPMAARQYHPGRSSVS